MNQITWIIIILIVVACIVACGEISARLVLHARNQNRYNMTSDPNFEMLRQLYLLASNSELSRDQPQQFLLN